VLAYHLVRMTDPDRVAQQARGLIVLDGLLTAPPVRDLIPLLEAVSDHDVQAAGPAFGALFRALLEPPGSVLDRLAEALLHNESALTRADVSEAAVQAARADLRVLQALAHESDRLPRAVATLTGGETPALPESTGAVGPVCEWSERLRATGDWADLAPALIEHYQKNGAGPLARNAALRWTGAALEPIGNPDVPSPRSLVGYEVERALLHRTTAQFVAGHPGNSVLLYGDRGTGKSSSVKSLLHADSVDGAGWHTLRLIEVPKARLADFPRIVTQLRGRPQRFILFVDDLSFEDGETEYKDMKAMLEGGLEARPNNVVVYATSNRRHLIREQFSDRASPDSEEVHARDTVQEKLSFSDRFGVTITFPSPDQAAYLAIVEGLAAQRGLDVERPALRARAIEWAAWHNGRSGRTARQFVDYLEGERGLTAAPGTAAAAAAAAAAG